MASDDESDIFAEYKKTLSTPEEIKALMEEWGVTFDITGYTYLKGDKKGVFLSLGEVEQLEPYGLNFSVREKPNKDLREWILEDNLLVQEVGVVQTTVDGLPALRWASYGLTQYDNVVVEHGDKIFLFTGDWNRGENGDPNLNKLLETVRFSSGL